jgi:hypothetical protein
MVKYIGLKFGRNFPMENYKLSSHFEMGSVHHNLLYVHK